MNCPACETPNSEGARYCAKCGALMPIAHVDGADPMIGQVVGGRYRIVGLLGEGGMGRVYVGEQQMGTTVRKVAVKTLLEEFSKDQDVVARFMRECGTVVELEHANTIKFYDFGQTNNGDLYIAMEFVDGMPLADVIETGGAMNYERVDHILKQMSGSLHEAHEKGVVHRDLKPENVILTRRAGEDDFVKVLDFGIAKRSEASNSQKEKKLTQAGMVLGTPPYMSPEQFTGKELDRRSDIYSLGVMAYEMLTGKLPFEANTPWEWATQHMTAQPFPFEKTGPQAAQIPVHIKEAIFRALSKLPEQRQDTAKTFYQEINAAARAHGARVLPPSVTGIPEAGSGASKPAATQIGDFQPPVAAMAPQAAPPAAGAPMASPHVPTAGGQAIPAPPPPMGGSRESGGGGNRGALIAAAGALAAVLVVIVIYMAQGGTDNDDPPPPISATSAPPAPAPATATDNGAGGADSENKDGDGGSAAEAKEDPKPQPPTPRPKPTAPRPKPKQPKPPSPASGTSACNQAIQAALGGRCGAARSALSRCSGHKKQIAQLNVNNKCRGKR